MNPAMSSALAAKDVVAIGETMVLLTPDKGVALADAVGLSVQVGGAESNVALHLARLGFEAAWVSIVGDDPLGSVVRRSIAVGGVDVSGVRTTSAAATGVYFKDFSDPTSTSVYYYRAGSAASLMSPALLDEPLVASSRIVHLSGVTAALSDSCHDLLDSATRQRERSGTLISFDVNYRRQLWRSRDAAGTLARLANRSDIVFVGLDEAKTLWGTSTVEDVRALLPAPSRLVVKNEAIGAHSLGEEHVFAPAPIVEVVETVGAGDAFAAGYLSGLLRGEDEITRLRMGHLVASRALTVTGDHVELPPISWFRDHVGLTAERWADLRLGESVG